MNKNPLVSVIIPTYNSERTIDLCLKSIKIRVIKILKILIANRYNMWVYQLDCERTKAKNYGLRRARGDYVLFVDSDMELTERVVEECVELAEKSDAMGW